MTMVTRKMPSPEGLAPGQTATVRLPISLTYHQLVLAYGGMTLAQMEQIRVVADGEVFQTYKGGDELDELNRDEGRNPAGGYLILDFNRFGLRTLPAEEITAIGTNHREDPRPLTTFALEIDVAAAAAAPTLSVKAVLGNPAKLGMVKKIKRYIYNPTAAGEYEISDLPKGDQINKITFKNADITKLTIERDSFVAFERTRAENDRIRADYGRGLILNAFIYDPTEAGAGSETLTTLGVQDLRFKLEMANPGVVPVIVEYIGILDF